MAGSLIQLKVALHEICPLIWRRILVEEERTFEELHHIIQLVMGWHGDHWHFFSMDERRIGSVELDDVENEDQLVLSELLQGRIKKLRYRFHPGECWEHDITVEKVFKPGQSHEDFSLHKLS